VEPSLLLAVCLLLAGVAFLYSSVGHGGASGYLAVLSLFSFGQREMSSTALTMNIIVAGIAFFAYFRAGHFSLKLILPFLLTSIPLAFVGGSIALPAGSYDALLAAALLVAALRLSLNIESGTRDAARDTPPPLAVALPVGGGIGLLSGIVGIGGGIFLSPLLLLLRWADPKRTAAASACFILLNSLAGIAARLWQGTFSTGLLLPLLAAALAGGMAGSWLGSKKFSGLTLRRLLAVVLLLAAVKLVVHF
jgi:uncharacterized membrane protein YfcA